MNDIKKFVKKLEKYKDSDVSNDKIYVKDLIKKELEKNKKVDISSLITKFGFGEVKIQQIIDEINEENTKKTIKKPVKVNKKLEFFKKLKDKKIFDQEDKKTLKEFLIKALVFGVLINFSLFVIFGIKFKWYSPLGWGIGLWLIKNELINIIRSVWIR